MIPEIFHIGPIPLHSFGLMMVLTFVSSWVLLARIFVRHGYDAALAERLVFWAAGCGLLGARILYLLSDWEAVERDPLGMIFSGAGFVFYGGFLAGLIAVVFILRKEKLSVLEFGDYIAPALAIGYAVGRLGCDLSGDGDYGITSQVPWAIGYPLGVVPTLLGVTVHPTPLYETIGSLILCYVLISLLQSQRPRRKGEILALYLFCSAVLRFLVEYLRIEPVVLFGYTQAQVVSVLVVLITAVTLPIPFLRAATKDL